MAIWDDRFSNEFNETQYSDGDIELEMLHMVKNGSVDWYSDKRWPVVYHFSHLRHNILNWYPFPKNASVLEVGAGCGALTGLLCERVKEVVALELTTIRARINFERHHSADNLRIVVGDFAKFESDNGFDYIVINGVLEYAAYMFKNEDPYRAFLLKAKSLLKPKGRILLAIANRFGLKYFAGSREDHTGLWFSGVNNYTRNERVRTFTRTELESKVIQSGLKALRFYYPYPDYKFPQEIFTDTSINQRCPESVDLHMDLPWEQFFDTTEVQKSLSQGKIAQYFANSFLVEMGTEDMQAADGPDYVKISANRRPEFQITTMLYFSEGIVKKKALNEQGTPHIHALKAAAGKKLGFLCNVEALQTSDDHEYAVPIVSLENFQQHLEMLFKQQKETAIAYLKQFIDHLLAYGKEREQQQSEAFEHIFGDAKTKRRLHWMANANIDLIPENLFIDGEKIYVIDYEWIIDCDVPIEYCIWRMCTSINEHLNTRAFDAVLQHYGIDEELTDTFAKWEIHFAQIYVGMKPLSVLTQPNWHSFDDVINGTVCSMKQELIAVYDAKGVLANENDLLKAKVSQTEQELLESKAQLAQTEQALIENKAELTQAKQQLLSMQQSSIRWKIRKVFEKMKGV